MTLDLFDTSILGRIRAQLTGRKESVAVAESVTSGLLQVAFSGAEFAATFFQGGITAYNLGQKSRHLAIDPVHGMACNCVSEKIASQMATAVTKLFSCDWGLGITGYATPVPESNNQLFAYCAIAYKDDVVFTDKILPAKASPFDVQLHYANHLLDALAIHLEKR